MMIQNWVLWVLIIVIGATSAADKNDAQSEILEQTYINDGSGNYDFRFETSNGLYRMETGKLTTDNDSNQKYTVRGYYSYIDPDGKEVTVHYIADENGYVIVKPPPISAAGVPGPLLASLLG